MATFEDRRNGGSQYRTLLRAVIMLAAAIIILTSLTTVTIVRLVDQSASQSQIQRVERVQQRVEAAQQHALLEGCVRLNAKDQTDNLAHYGDFIVFSFVEQRFTVPTSTETAAQKRITREFTAKLHSAVNDANWTPLTNCRRAVNEQGAAYKQPKAIPFSQKLPPKSAL